MTEHHASIDSILSSFRRFTWKFHTSSRSIQTSLSCYAFSVKEARQRLIKCLQQIDSLSDERTNIHNQLKILHEKYIAHRQYNWTQYNIEKEKLEKPLVENVPPIDNNIGHACRPEFEYSLNMEC